MVRVYNPRKFSSNSYGAMAFPLSKMAAGRKILSYMLRRRIGRVRKPIRTLGYLMRKPGRTWKAPSKTTGFFGQRNQYKLRKKGSNLTRFRRYRK